MGTYLILHEHGIGSRTALSEIARPLTPHQNRPVYSKPPVGNILRGAVIPPPDADHLAIHAARDAFGP